MLDVLYCYCARLRIGHMSPSNYSFEKFVAKYEFAATNIGRYILFFSKRTKKICLIERTRVKVFGQYLFGYVQKRANSEAYLDRRKRNQYNSDTF